MRPFYAAAALVCLASLLVWSHGSAVSQLLFPVFTFCVGAVIGASAVRAAIADSNG